MLIAMITYSVRSSSFSSTCIEIVVVIVCDVQSCLLLVLGASEVLVEGLVERDEHLTKQGSLNAQIGKLTQYGTNSRVQI